MQRDLWSAFAERSQRRAERQERLRRLDTDLDWRSWLRHRFAAYWYGLLVVFADIGVIASVFSFLPQPAGPGTYAIGIAFVVPAAYLEWELYRMLWPGDDEVLESLERKAEADRAADPSAPARAARTSGEGRAPPGGDGGTRET
jgi:hypothetical protein